MKLDARFVAPPPSFTLCLKRHLGQYWFIYLKCYSEWQLGVIQIELTTLTLRFTEDSAKQLVNSLQLTVICTIRLLREVNVFYVSPAHKETDYLW